MSHSVWRHKKRKGNVNFLSHQRHPSNQKNGHLYKSSSNCRRKSAYFKFFVPVLTCGMDEACHRCVYVCSVKNMGLMYSSIHVKRHAATIQERASKCTHTHMCKHCVPYTCIADLRFSQLCPPYSPLYTYKAREQATETAAGTHYPKQQNGETSLGLKEEKEQEKAGRMMQTDSATGESDGLDKTMLPTMQIEITCSTTLMEETQRNDWTCRSRNDYKRHSENKGLVWAWSKTEFQNHVETLGGATRR